MRETLLFAPAEYWRLTGAQRADICNGCGTKGFGGYVVPDFILGVRITAACDIHDFMYTVGVTIDDKHVADRSFLNNMLRLIENKTRRTRLNLLLHKRADMAYVYYLAVSRFGGPAFWHGKNRPEDMGYVSLDTTPEAVLEGIL